MKKGIYIAFSIIFLGAICTPLAKTIFSKAQEVSVDENRALKPFPDFDLQLLDKFPPGFNAYWADHFGFRDWFINQNHHIKMSVLKVSPVPDQVIFGSDGWFFMKGKPYQCYAGLNKFSHSELKEGKSQLQYRADFAKKLGIPYIIFVAPNKHRIYEEKLPMHISKLTDSMQIDQLIALAKNIDGIDVIDLAPALLSKKDMGNLYLKTDNHWNAVGAFVAYQQMVETMQSYFPQIPNAYGINDYSVAENIDKGGALARYLKDEENLADTYYNFDLSYNYALYADEDEKFESPEGFWYPEEYERRTINERDSTLPKILWFRDSFGRLVAPHLVHHFAYTTEIFDSWKYRLNEEIILEEKPDAVIILILERNLKCLMTGGDCGGNF